MFLNFAGSRTGKIWHVITPSPERRAESLEDMIYRMNISSVASGEPQKM